MKSVEFSFVNRKFSLAAAFGSAFKLFFEYISLYLLIALVVLIVDQLFAVWMEGTVLQLIDLSVLTKQPTLLLGLLAKWLGAIDFKSMSGMNFFDVLKRLFPENLLNQDLANVTFKEYLLMLWAHRWLLGASVLGMAMVSCCMSIGKAKIALDLYDQKTVSLKYLYKFYYLVPRIMFTQFLVAVLFIGMAAICLLGLALLGMRIFMDVPTYAAVFAGIVGLIVIVVAPLFTIFLYQRIRFMRYLVIDKNLSIRAALKSSWNMTRGCVVHLAGFSFLSVFVLGKFLEGFLTFFLFSLHTQAEVSVYRQLVGK